jgi:uracil-DNA glycosylase
LENWEDQGVLLLNAALSCSPGKPGSHMLLWRPFIKSLLVNLSSCLTGIVYVLMGSEAQSFESCINARSNHIIRIRHPSHYARTSTKMPNIWKEINQILKGIYGAEIEWYKESQ